MLEKVFFLRDASSHDIVSTEFEELCRLPLDPGSYLVIAKGVVVLFDAEAIVRLDVHGVTDEMSIMNAQVPDSFSRFGIGIGMFSFVVATTIPAKGGAGSGAPPDLNHRATLLARRHGHSTGSVATVHHSVTIAAIPVEEIVATTVF